MNGKKLLFFFTELNTNWKYILIVLILAFFVGGGIFGYQWWSSNEEEVLIVEKPQIKQKITVTTDKTDYERAKETKVNFIILNNFSFPIYFPSRLSETTLPSERFAPETLPADYYAYFQTKAQKYDYDKKQWEEVSPNISSPYSKISVHISPGEVKEGHIILSLEAGEKTEDYAEIGKIIEPLRLDSEKYRLTISYYENKMCGGTSYWKNKELCDKEIKIAFSNEFVVKGAIIPEGTIEPALNFCREKDGLYYYDKAFFLNFDVDEDKEIIGLCWKGEYDKEGLMFVLDKQNNQYKSVLEREGEAHQRYYTFENLKINDVDRDGIDEIIYEESGWYGGGGDSYLHLYSPKYNEWFWHNNWWKINIDTGAREEGASFSPNIDLEGYKVFKEFILEQ